MVRGLLNSHKGDIAHYITEIPCNIIATLESDAGQAEQFVNQIEKGQVPTIISDLPKEAVDVFGDVLNVLTMIPSEIINVTEAAATDVVNIVDDIEDGSITSVLAAIPSEIVAGITNGWGDLTNGITDAVNGLTDGFKCDILGQCPSTPVQTCGTPQTGAATTTAVNASATPANNSPAAYIASTASVASASSASSLSALGALTASMQSVTQSPIPTFNRSTPHNSTQPSLAGRSVDWAVGSLLGIAVVGILGIAVLL